MAGSRYWGLFRVKNIELPQILMDEFTAAMDKRAGFFPEEEYSATFDNNNLGTGMLNLGSLKELNVTNNTIGHVPTISTTSNCLTKVDLSGSDTGNGFCLSTLLSSCNNLHELLLNSMPSGVIVANDCLISNPPLQILGLNWNHLGDDDGEVLAASLGTNTNLKTLWLHGNNFSQVAEHAFTKAICNDKDLNAVIDSNHTCTVYGVSEHVMNLQCTKEEKKFRSLKPNGVSFIDVPLELMPVVLAWLQSVPSDEDEEDDDIYVLPNAISFMFDALRSYWDLPSLFVGRHQPEEVKMCLRDMISTISNEEEIVCGQSFHQALLPPRKHGEYDTVLPMTNRGLLINLGELVYKVGAFGNDERLNYTAFMGYRRFPDDGSKGTAEIFTLVKQQKDVLTAVNGISVIGKSFKEIVTLMKQVIKLPFLHLRLQSWNSIRRPMLDSAQLEYDICYDKSVSIQQEKTQLENDIRYDKVVSIQQEKVLVDSQKSSSDIEELQRSHTRTQNDLKNRLQQVEERF